MLSRSELHWRCRRGTLELDLMLGRFLEKQYDNSSETVKLAFEGLLTLEDPQLLKYLMGRESPKNKDLAGLVQTIRSITATGT